MQKMVVLKHNLSHFSKQIKVVIDQFVGAHKPTILMHWTFGEDKYYYEQDLLNGIAEEISRLKTLCYEITITTYNQLQSHCNTSKDQVVQ